MATGWPRNQQDLRWPDSEDTDTSPRGHGDRGTGSFSGEFGADHPSGPLPVSPAAQPQPRGRLGRGRSRAGRGPAGGGDVADADYDWIRYLGEAGPAQEAPKPPSTPVADRDLSAGSRGNARVDSDRRADSGGGADAGSGAGRLLPRRHAAPTEPPGVVGQRASAAPSAPSIAGTTARW